METVTYHMGCSGQPLGTNRTGDIGDEPAQIEGAQTGGPGKAKIPIRNSRKRNLVEQDTNSDNETRKRYRTRFGTQLRIYVNCGKTDCRKTAARLVKLCKEDPTRIAVA